MTKVIVTSANKISSKQLASIKQAVTKKYGSSVEVIEKIDQSLIGGLSIMIGSKILDASVKGKLSKIYEEYKKN